MLEVLQQDMIDKVVYMNSQEMTGCGGTGAHCTGGGVAGGGKKVMVKEVVAQ